MTTHDSDNESSQPAPGPLNSIRVLDVATVYAAPITAMLLGDYGSPSSGRRERSDVSQLPVRPAAGRHALLQQRLRAPPALADAGLPPAAPSADPARWVGAARAGTACRAARTFHADSSRAAGPSLTRCATGGPNLDVCAATRARLSRAALRQSHPTYLLLANGFARRGAATRVCAIHRR